MAVVIFRRRHRAEDVVIFRPVEGDDLDQREDRQALPMGATIVAALVDEGEGPVYGNERRGNIVLPHNIKLHTAREAIRTVLNHPEFDFEHLNPFDTASSITWEWTDDGETYQYVSQDAALPTPTAGAYPVVFVAGGGQVVGRIPAGGPGMSR